MKNNKLSMHILSALTVFFFLYLVYGCDDTDIPSISFDSPFPKREKNLVYILGEQLTLVSNKDTQTVKISFNNSTKQNLIIDINTKDTLTQCWVSKFRQLYYFTEQIDDTTYWIYAVKIEGNVIKGLFCGAKEMYTLENEIYNGKYSDIVKYIDKENDLIRLKFNKTKLKSFYKSIIDTLPAIKILGQIENNKNIGQTDTITILTSKIILEQSSSIVKNIYPNPAIDLFSIDFDDVGVFKIDIHDINGKLIKSSRANSDKTSISLSGINSGIYFVRVTQQETNETAIIKLIVKK